MKHSDILRSCRVNCEFSDIIIKFTIIEQENYLKTVFEFFGWKTNKVVIFFNNNVIIYYNYKLLKLFINLKFLSKSAVHNGIIQLQSIIFVMLRF